jgi:hypothetical protein
VSPPADLDCCGQRPASCLAKGPQPVRAQDLAPKWSRSHAPTGSVVRPGMRSTRQPVSASMSTVACTRSEPSVPRQMSSRCLQDCLVTWLKLGHACEQPCKRILLDGYLLVWRGDASYRHTATSGCSGRGRVPGSDPPGRPGEFHPRAPTDRSVKVSLHSARLIRSRMRSRSSRPSGRKGVAALRSGPSTISGPS